MKKILFIGVICLHSTISVFSQSKKTWEKTRYSDNTAAGYTDFLTKYPKGKYTELAKERLAYIMKEDSINA